MYNYKERIFEYEFDSSLSTYEQWYKKNLYSSSEYKLEDYDYRAASISGNKYKRIHMNCTYKMINHSIKVSGDCDFNFNEKKVEKFRHIIDELECTDKKNEIIDTVIRLSKRHHDFSNCSLLPTTGRINNIKGTVISEFDRLDTFIYYLNEYFENENDKILPPLDSMNYKELKSFLDKFKSEISGESIYFFCKVIYNNNQPLEKSDKELINKLVKNGSQSLRCQKIFETYLELAENWWQFKGKHKL